jgi:hypothetical protein
MVNGDAAPETTHAAAPVAAKKSAVKPVAPAPRRTPAPMPKAAHLPAAPHAENNGRHPSSAKKAEHNPIPNRNHHTNPPTGDETTERFFKDV